SFLRWFPRSLVVWTGRAPTYGDITMGNVSGDAGAVLKPIPEKGNWYVIPGYMASTSAEGVHDRIGFRFDDIDEYWTLSLSVKLVGCPSHTIRTRHATS